MEDEKFTLHEDELGRVLLWCNTDHEQIVLEDVLSFRMKLSQPLGKFRAAFYTVKNLLRASKFIAEHQHDKEN